MMVREEDKRSFKRYESGSECEVVLPSGTHKGRLIDYSDGAGIEIENVPELKQGAEIEIKVRDYDLAFRGTVAWVGGSGQHLRAGIRRTDAFKGNLRNFKFADILIGINRRAWTGVLETKRDSIVRSIFIDKGDIIYAASSDKDDRLGERLMKEGKIKPVEFENASRILIKTGKKLGKILVDLCYLSPSELFQAVRKQIEDIIITNFQWDEGEFEFKEGPIPSDEVIPLQVSMANIIYRAMKRVENLKLIKQMCPSADDILNATHNPLRIFQSLNLEISDKKILALINGVYPLKTILTMSPTPNFETLKTICALMSIGLIYVKGERDAPEAFALDEIYGKTEEMAPQDFLEKIEGIFSKCETRGYYETLGVAVDASSAEIEKAYFQILKQFHPDRHFSFPSLDIKDKLMKIISYTTEGYEILSDPNRRREYDKTLVPGDPSTSSSHDTRGTEIPEPIAESITKETMHTELPDDIVSSGTQEDTVETKAGQEVPVSTMNHEEKSGVGGNGSYEEPEHTAISRDDARNAAAADTAGESGRTDTPPAWALDPAFRTPEEHAIQNEIADISRRISELQQESKELEQRIGAAGSIRALLYEQGKALELAVRDALTVLGFSARALKEGGSEFDIIFESPEGRCLGNVEGKDTMAISIDRFSQLERNLQEDFAREGVAEYAKGVLFGNVERLKPLKDRGEAFTGKCITAAKRVHFALVRTADLFEPVRYLRSHPDPDYAKLCREAIFKTEGDMVAFPPALARR